MDLQCATGQYAYSCAAGQYYIGTWLQIIANTEDTLTVDGVLDATGTSIRTCPWNPIHKPTNTGADFGAYAPVNGWFWDGCVDDDGYVWFCACGAPEFLKLDPRTDEIIGRYPHGYGVSNSLFFGLINAGGYLWTILAFRQT